MSRSSGLPDTFLLPFLATDDYYTFLITLVLRGFFLEYSYLHWSTHLIVYPSILISILQPFFHLQFRMYDNSSEFWRFVISPYVSLKVFHTLCYGPGLRLSGHNTVTPAPLSNCFALPSSKTAQYSKSENFLYSHGICFNQNDQSLMAFKRPHTFRYIQSM